ncbi:type I phosphomannose isomerase catalytic subunit [Gallalistipes aquisgranensis]|mgnify:FL=1|uniref:type I phosphomannose isomerase catalytic subunit n=1 Tax=Gallalistipes aquisgranensis TaxID=2779358 RepID=UPI001CF8B641|nr:type I phosphomannose isomerase catalytic subunit [Gallalistipes aquisgranensis]MBE5034482.1 class I mannose-6-phosphate isomerase [Gallalistipes aquisgranensis]
MLYPLKFKPLYKERIWGGQRLASAMGKKVPEGVKIGESWEISGVEGDVSVVANGCLKGNDLQELIEVYMGDLVGEKIYDRYGLEFPVLIKLIDAEDVLSIQVHPDDRLAEERHHSYGKTEMWYVIAAEPGASLYVGFNRQVTRQEYLDAVAAGTLPSLLNKVEVKAGDAYFIPAGTVHAIGKGLLIAEIQQTSDITYRVDDWGRVGADGKPRELHTELAVDAIDFGAPQNYDVTSAPVLNTPVQIKECPYFTTNVIQIHGMVERDFTRLDSFVIYICLGGELQVRGAEGSTSLVRGETTLVPAEEEEIVLEGQGTVLEVYIC